MKQVFVKAVICLWVLTAFFSPAYAQTASGTPHTSAAQALPASTDILYSLNTAVDNPLEQVARQQVTMLGGNEMTDLLLELAEDNTVTFAMDLDSENYANEKMYITMNMSEEDFARFLAVSFVEISEVYGDKTIYKFDDEGYAVMLGDLCLITNTVENARLAAATYEKPETSLANSAAYLSVTSHDLPDSFINMFINPSFAGEALGMESPSLAGFGFSGTFLSLIEAMTGESISAAKVSDGIRFSVAVEADAEKLDELNMPLGKYNFSPSLFRIFSGKGLIYYQERANLAEQFNDMLRLFDLGDEAMAELNTFKVDFKNETGIDFDRELLPLLTGKYMVAVHNTGQLLPGVSVVFDVGYSNAGKAGQMMLKISEYLKAKLQEEEAQTGTGFFSYGIYGAGSTSFYEFAINLKELDESGDMALFPDEAVTVYLRMAVTTDGRMVISTLPDLSGMFMKTGDGLLDNETLKKEFSDPSATVNQVAFLDADGAYAYAGALMDLMSVDTDTKTAVDELFKPWHSLFIRSYGQDGSVWAEGKLNFDIDGMGAFAGALGDLYGMDDASEIYEPLTFRKTFCDVSYADWYYPYVSDLSSQGVINGYDDGCFRPDQPVTRAEFMKMAMQALGKAAAINTSFQPFEDVPPLFDAWYSQDVNMASMLGYVKGYDDGTFRPESLITRAEAVQILYNMSNTLPGVNVIGQPLESIIQFDDVRKTDWFYTPVIAAYYFNLVDGVTPSTFEPERNITRAEAAKIINLLQIMEQ